MGNRVDIHTTRQGTSHRKALTRFVAVVAVLLAGSAMAQSATDTNMEILKQKITANKKLLVTHNMDLNDAEAKQFWPLYDSYQKELEQLDHKLGKTITEYAEALNKGPVPNDTAKKLMKEVLNEEEQEVKLKRSYVEKLGKVLPATKAARYLQIENKIRTVVKAELAQVIPLVY
jgi:flagellar motor component MotA